MKVLFLTRTKWDEPPRIRHQMTWMLTRHGYEVHFFEKCNYNGIIPKISRKDDIILYSHAELIHHQLRYFPIIQKMNNTVVKFYLRWMVKEIQFDIIFNFCYEYSFLKDMFPEKKVITIIEDDFEAQAKFGMRKAIRNQVRATCLNSDEVLTVSYPLFDRLVRYKSNVHLFFPWSHSIYRPPSFGKERNVALYFGYVGRLDWRLIERLVLETKYNFRFVGPPIRNSDSRWVTHLLAYKNFEYIPSSTLQDLNVEDVFCSILPYNPLIESVQACSVSNRAFNLLALGLPLIYTDLKSLISAPKSVIRSSRTPEEFISHLEYFSSNFEIVQDSIKQFLEDHYEIVRWQSLLKIIHNN